MYFFTMEEYFKNTKGLLLWLHECVDENIKGAPYEYNWYSDGSCSWQYKSKNYKWEITKSMNRVTFMLDEEYEIFYKLKFK